MGILNDYATQISSDLENKMTNIILPTDLTTPVSEVVFTETTVMREETSHLPIFVATTEPTISFSSQHLLTTESFESRLKCVQEKVKRDREKMFAIKPVPHYSDPFLYKPEKKVKKNAWKQTTHFPMNYGTTGSSSSTLLSTPTADPVVKTSTVPYIENSTNMATGVVRSSTLGPLDNPTSRDLYAGVLDLTHWTGKLVITSLVCSGSLYSSLGI